MPSLVESAQARRFTGKSALIVGAGSGAGRAVALRLGLEGARIAFAARSAPHVDEGERFLQSHGVAARGVRVDAATPEGAKAAVAAAVSAHGGLDVLVVTAGGYEGGTFDQIEAAALERMLDVNLRAAFHSVRFAAPEIARRGGGAIVVTTAVYGAAIPGPGLLAYNTSKAAAQGFVMSLAGELAPSNIRVNAVLPGGIAHQFDPARDVAKGRKVGKGPAQPEDIAAAVAFLASDEACFLTGASLVVDGGFSVSRKPY